MLLRMASLNNRVSLITGAARGIGLSISKALLDHGGKVVLLDVMEEIGQETCLELSRKYGNDKVVFYRCDVTSEEELRSAFVRAIEKFGKLDVVVNNAGVADEIGWQRTVNINLAAVIQGTYLGIEFMSKDNGGTGGSIINISSYAGLLPEATTPVYSATKAGVISFTQALRRLAKTDGVRVNCICPTWINTDMGKMAMFDSPDRVKDMVKQATLLSPQLVADAVILLVQDTSKAGMILRVTPRNGIDFHTFDKTTLLSLMKPKL